MTRPRLTASFPPSSSAVEDAEFRAARRAPRTARPRLCGRAALRPAPDSAARPTHATPAAKHLGGLFIDVTGEAHAVPLPGHVHAGPVGPVLSVMGMCQRRTLPRAEFLSHRSLLLADQKTHACAPLGAGSAAPRNSRTSISTWCCQSLWCASPSVRAAS